MTQIVACPDAVLGAGDPTRRWGVRCSDGTVRWPGVTMIEAEALIAGLASHLAPTAPVLAQAELGVALSDGAGPYLVDADGVLVLVVDRHPALAGLSIALGQPGADRARIGVVRRAGVAGVWCWSARVDVPGAARIPVLDDLAAVDAEDAVTAWAARANSPGIP